MENRVISNLRKGIEKGENTFLFYGEYIHDWFLFDLYQGVRSLPETLKQYFLVQEKYDGYIYCKNELFEAYQSVNGLPKECGQELFHGNKAGNDDSEGLSLGNVKQGKKSKQKEEEVPEEPEGEEEKADAQTVDAAREAANSSERNFFLKSIDFCRKEKEKKIVFFFEDYEWTAGLYKSSNDDQLLYIEKLKELAAMKNVVLILTLEDAQMLKKYNFKIDGKNTVMLASPAVEEVYSTYLRKYMRRYKRGRIGGLFLKELREIAEAVASGEKSLKEAMRIFDRVMAEKEGVLEKKDFEGALDKAIEEKVSLEDVVLDEDVKETIVAQIDKFLKTKNVAEVTKGLVLAGPPGTGKTYLVKALANEKNCYFMSPSLADLKAEYVGQSGPKIKRIFQQARANAPTIIFIDEADTVFPSREASGNDSDSFAKDMVNQFLVEMDGMLSGDSRVFIVAATNRENALDSAIISRLGEPVKIPLPGKEQRKQLFSGLLKKEGMEFNKFIFVDEFLDKTNHLSGRDIKNFVDSMRTQTQKKTRTIADYVEEQETQELFYRCLKIFEDTLVQNLERELGITIAKPNNKVDYGSIIGCEEIKEVIDRQMRQFDTTSRKEAEKFSIRPKKGILLYGPPGNGKSKLAEAAANMHNLYFMKITSDTFTKISLSEQNQTLIRIFSSALQLSEICSEQRGVLLFFDEFDSLASRSILDSRVRGTMLTQLDSTDALRNPGSKVLFMAATNYFELLDEGMIRAGRIDDKLEMKNPTRTEGIQMLMQFCGINKKVRQLGDEMAEAAYDKYLEKFRREKQEALIKQELVRGWRREGRSERDLRSFAEECCEGLFPSGADLRNFSDGLISNAYYMGSIVGEDGDHKIEITEEIVDSVCRICEAG